MVQIASAAEALLEHRWGQSDHEDQVWAQVAGMAPGHLDRCYFMILQAYMDESVGEDGTFVFAGHLASVESWAAFSKEWVHMLPRNGLVDDDGEWYFHMVEMAQSPERMRRVPGFYRIIEKHTLLSISCRINAGELARAQARIEVPNVNIDWGPMADPYIAAFRCFMDHFHYQRRIISRGLPMLPADAVVDFYFDDHHDKKKIRAMWEEYVGSRSPREQRLLGREPRFEDDRRFLPLQAADLWAWWVRKWCQDGLAPRDALSALDFGGVWKGNGPSIHHLSYNEEQWVEAFAPIVAIQLPPYTPIKDRKTGRLIYERGMPMKLAPRQPA